MRLLDLTLSSPEENIALDEALLEEADGSATPQEILRVWESTSVAVVIGRSSRAADEVNVEFCREQSIPILRRCSGGAAVVIGPGCLMYAVVLSYHHRPALHLIDEVHRFVLGQNVAGIGSAGPKVTHQGISDLVIGDCKVSGNSLRCKRHALLYHGTLLYNFPIDLLTRCLRTAPRQPEYRAGREHHEFVTQLPLSKLLLRKAIQVAWPTEGPLETWPRDLTEKLVAERYSKAEWNLRF